MDRFKNYFIILIISFAMASKSDRLITIGGCVTESVFALGKGDNVLAVDISSTIPGEVKKLPQVGYIRAISSEGILSMMPNYILTTTDMGPSPVIDQIRNSGVTLEIFKSPHSFEEIIDLIYSISSILKTEKEGKVIISQMNLEYNSIKELINNYKYNPKIVFFMNPTAGSYTAAGSDTRADYLIEFIGGINIFSSQFSKYKKVTKEQIVNENPDIILVSSIGNNKDVVDIFIKSKEFKSITAISNNKVIDIDMSKYLSFGPSFTNSVMNLMEIVDIEKK
tara:strand:+ start:444 stop:1283 length:840 start_codon:yes stop_codon:yes gene_type:complete